MPPASWERRHPERREFWSLDYFTPDGSLGGFVGLATAAAAWYASFAAVTNSTFGRAVIPVKPLQRD